MYLIHSGLTRLGGRYIWRSQSSDQLPCTEDPPSEPWSEARDSPKPHRKAFPTLSRVIFASGGVSGQVVPVSRNDLYLAGKTCNSFYYCRTCLRLEGGSVVNGFNELRDAGNMIAVVT